MYSYFPARVFIPLLGIVIICLSSKKLLAHPKHIFIFIVLTLLSLSPLLFHMFSGDGFSRWNAVKGDNNLSTISRKYLSYFSYDYLFSKGDIDYPGQFITRHSIHGLGQLFLFQLPLFLIGMFALFKNKYSWTTRLTLLFWLILYPIPDVFTNQNSPYATRSIIGVVPFQIVSALGVFFITNLFNKSRKLLMIVFTLVVSSNFFIFLNLFQKYPLYSSDYWGWQSGPKQIMAYFLEHQSSYQQLCLEGQFNAPQIFLKFYDPENRCLDKCQICDHQSFDPSQKQLFAISHETYVKLGQQLNFSVSQVVRYPNDQPAFFIGEIHETQK